MSGSAVTEILRPQTDDPQTAELAIEADEITRAQAGDEAALEALVMRHQADILHSLERKAGVQTAEDITQTTMLKLTRGLESFENRGSGLRGWLYRVATNDFRSRYKHDKKFPKISLDELSVNSAEKIMAGATPTSPSPEDIVVQRIFLAETLAVIQNNLSTERYQVWRLATFEELSHEQIAEQLGIPKNTVHSRLRRARLAIKRLADTGQIDAPMGSSFGLTRIPGA